MSAPYTVRAEAFCYRVVGGVLGDDGPSFQYGTDAEDAAERFNAVHRAALEWAAEQVKEEGCSGCEVAVTPSRYRPAREDPREHGPRCPIALVAKIRKGAP